MLEQHSEKQKNFFFLDANPIRVIYGAVSVSSGVGARRARVLCVEMGFYADISCESRCNIEINF